MFLIVLNILNSLQIHCIKIKRYKNVKSLSSSHFCAPTSWFPFLRATPISDDQCFRYILEILYEVYF